MANAIAQGVDGQPSIVAESGDPVVVDPQVHPPPPTELYHVITFRGTRIVLIQDYPDRPSAMVAITR